MSFSKKVSSFFDWLLPGFKRTTSLPGTIFQHPNLGQVVFEDEGWWRGKCKVGEREIEFSVPDDGTGIDEMQAESCVQVLRSFDMVVQKAVRLISSELKSPENEILCRFTPTDLWGFSLHKNKQSFYLSFSDSENKYALWRVQFEDDKAKCLGCDT